MCLAEGVGGEGGGARANTEGSVASKPGVSGRFDLGDKGDFAADWRANVFQSD